MASSRSATRQPPTWRNPFPSASYFAPNPILYKFTLKLPCRWSSSARHKTGRHIVQYYLTRTNANCLLNLNTSVCAKSSHKVYIHGNVTLCFPVKNSGFFHETAPYTLIDVKGSITGGVVLKCSAYHDVQNDSMVQQISHPWMPRRILSGYYCLISLKHRA
jgi:hypothetical protein